MPMESRSKIEPRLSADSTPIDTPLTSQMIAAPTARSAGAWPFTSTVPRFRYGPRIRHGILDADVQVVVHAVGLGDDHVRGVVGAVQRVLAVQQGHQRGLLHRGLVDITPRLGAGR